MQHGPLSPWQAWAGEVQQKLIAQQALIEQLELQVADLCEKIKQLEARPSYTIESIEYHFDQLKVEKLDGTLNIGMTAPGAGGEQPPGGIEQLSVPAPEVFPSAAPAITPQSEQYHTVYDGMLRYFDKQAVEHLIALETDLGIPLDPYHRKIIINDIKKQVPTRINYYLQQTESGNGNDADNDALCGSVLAKTTRDAKAAMLSYMKQLQTGDAPSGGMT